VALTNNTIVTANIDYANILLGLHGHGFQFSSVSPYVTVVNGVNAANNGDIVLVRPGNYNSRAPTPSQ